jgi:hypothetical protein
VWVKGLKQQPATPPSNTSSSTDATSTLTAAAVAAAATGTSSSSTVTSPRLHSPCHSLSVGAATLMPDDVDDRSWCKAFALSDHRPLQVRINFNDSNVSSGVSSDDDAASSKQQHNSSNGSSSSSSTTKQPPPLPL